MTPSGLINRKTFSSLLFDAMTAYVLRVIIYRGTTTYSCTGNAVKQPLKTVQIVNKLNRS